MSSSTQAPQLGQVTFSLGAACKSILGSFSLVAKTIRYKTTILEMETWLRAQGFTGLYPGLGPPMRRPPFTAAELQGLKRDKLLRQQLDKLGWQLPSRDLFLEEMRSIGSDASQDFQPVRSRNPRSEPRPSKAPTTPHPKARPAPATPLKPVGTRRRYTRKMPPRKFVYLFGFFGNKASNASAVAPRS